MSRGRHPPTPACVVPFQMSKNGEFPHRQHVATVGCRQSPRLPRCRPRHRAECSRPARSTATSRRTWQFRKDLRCILAQTGWRWLLHCVCRCSTLPLYTDTPHNFGILNLRTYTLWTAYTQQIAPTIPSSRASPSIFAVQYTSTDPELRRYPLLGRFSKQIAQHICSTP